MAHKVGTSFCKFSGILFFFYSSFWRFQLVLYAYNWFRYVSFFFFFNQRWFFDYAANFLVVVSILEAASLSLFVYWIRCL